MPRKANFNDNIHKKINKAFVCINQSNDSIMKKLYVIETNQDKLKKSISMLRARIEKVENIKTELLEDLDIITKETKTLSMSIINLDSGLQ